MANNYDNENWESSVRKHAALFIDTLSDMITSKQKANFHSLKRLAERLIEQTELALNEDKNFNLSPIFKEIDNKWISGLRAYQIGAKCARDFAIDAKNGNVNSESGAMSAGFIDEGGNHIEKFGELLEKENLKRGRKH
jgi:hypothetical protein